MNANLLSFVKDSFAKLLTESSLQLCASRPNEVIMIGPAYAMFVWLDRDGTALYYLDLAAPDNRKAADVAAYLGTKRRWIIGEQPPPHGNWEAGIRFGLHNCELTLMTVGQDILRGDKEWLSAPSVRYITLSELHREQISLAIVKCLSGKNR